ncbi:MAG: endonuclease/exonuclease/phosphatase family protein [Planctomycetia bacterium]|nr:endonuclease/exonuclease/phosphatase family protein [Planctomycetia bacterium]
MRLLTYNIHKGIGGRDRRYRLPRIIEVIEHENPDLILMQEVTHLFKRCGGDDQATLLSEHFRAVDKMYQMNVNLKSGGYGNLLISRWPIIERHQISLRLKQKKPRGAQIAVVDTPEGPLKIVNLHLGLAEAERHWQVAHLLEHRLFQATANVPELIVGDYNDWRNTLAAGPMTRHGFQHITTPPSRFRSFPAYFALGSLDKAFHRRGVVVNEARVVSSKAAKSASDHLPLVLDFHLQAEGASASVVGPLPGVSS